MVMLPREVAEEVCADLPSGGDAGAGRLSEIGHPARAARVCRLRSGRCRDVAGRRSRMRGGSSLPARDRIPQGRRASARPVRSPGSCRRARRTAPRHRRTMTARHRPPARKPMRRQGASRGGAAGAPPRRRPRQRSRQRLLASIQSGRRPRERLRGARRAAARGTRTIRFGPGRRLTGRSHVVYMHDMTSHRDIPALAYPARHLHVSQDAHGRPRHHAGL